MIELRFATLDGRRIAYHSETEFLIEIGKGRGAYHVKKRFIGNLAQALAWYKGFNMAAPYKKRLRAPSMNRPVLARYIPA